MINEKKTLELFGYTSDKLSYGSDKKVVVTCDGCNKERIVRFRWNESLCRSCVQIGKKISEKTRKNQKKNEKK